MNYFKEPNNQKTIAIVAGTTLGLAATYYAYTSLFSSQPEEDKEVKQAKKPRKVQNKEKTVGPKEKKGVQDQTQDVEF